VRAHQRARVERGDDVGVGQRRETGAEGPTRAERVLRLDREQPADQRRGCVEARAADVLGAQAESADLVASERQASPPS
jgi:hypothetical protein